MAGALTGGVKLSKTSPAFLHANSTSHTWIFSAIAELIDNSYDSEAKTLWIDKKVIHETDALVFMDDGKGMSPQELHHMLSFGYCDKQDTTIRPVGQYGNGFKSGSMRLGLDAIVFTKNSHNLSVGFLSQTYLRTINADTILVPIISWDAKTKKLVQSPDLKGSMQAITTHSIFRSAQELTREFVSMSVAKTGTRIIIYNLKRGQSNRYELDFESNPNDIINSESTMVDEYILRNEITIIPAFRRSLREYCSILFLRPRMKIVLRNCKVKTKLIGKSLSKTEKDVYNPRWLNSRPVKITFGFTSLKQDYGILMYSKNRLIKAYEKVGFQKQANSLGVGVVGVVQTDFLEPIHNKQDFNKTDHYNTFMAALGVKLNDYWHAKMGTENDRPQQIAPARPDWNWVQCENCLKWRRLADTQSPDELPEKWFCFMNTDTIHNRCDVPEEPEDEDELLVRATYSKTFKNQKKNQKQAQIKIKEEELNQKEEYLQQVEQHLREKVSQVPDLQKAKKDLEEAKKREREQIQYIRMLKQREKQIMAKQQKLSDNIPEASSSSGGTKRKGSALKVKLNFPKKKQKVVSEGEDFVITRNESDEEEKEEEVVDLDGGDKEKEKEKGKKKKKKTADVIVIDEDDDDDYVPTPRTRSDSNDVKPDVNELNKQMEADTANAAEASGEAAGESSVADPVPSTSDAEPVPSTSGEGDTSVAPAANEEEGEKEKDESMDHSGVPVPELAAQLATPALEPPEGDKEEEPSTTEKAPSPGTSTVPVSPKTTTPTRRRSSNASNKSTDEEKDKDVPENSSTVTDSATKTFRDQEVQVEVKIEIPDPIEAEEFKNCQAKLKDTKLRLKSLKENVFELLKLIVPDLEIANLDMVEGVVTEMIKMNQENPGGFMSPIRPTKPNGLSSERVQDVEMTDASTDKTKEKDKDSDKDSDKENDKDKDSDKENDKDSDKENDKDIDKDTDRDSTKDNGDLADQRTKSPTDNDCSITINGHDVDAGMKTGPKAKAVKEPESYESLPDIFSETPIEIPDELPDDPAPNDSTKSKETINTISSSEDFEIID